MVGLLEVSLRRPWQAPSGEHWPPMLSATRGDGNQDDIQALEDLSGTMMLSSLCGLGQAASIPVLDTIKYFRNDYETRIKQSIFLRSLRGKR